MSLLCRMYFMRLSWKRFKKAISQLYIQEENRKWFVSQLDLRHIE